MIATYELDVEKIRRMVLDQNLTITELQDKAGLSYGVIRNAVNGGGTTSKAVNKIAAALGCKPGEIVKG